jgi:hypothetical protein
MSIKTAALIVLAAGSVAAADTSITKTPDLGNFWNPLGNNGATAVYADSFIAPNGADVVPVRLGTWLDDLGTGGTDLRFEIWGDNNGPNPFDVLATTGTVSPSTNGLTYVEAGVQNGAQALVPGQRYWYVSTAVGEAGSGYFQTGGHTQNSIYQDNGTFWYSNDPNGINFDGQNLTPEMAFSVTLGAIPTPATAALLGLGGLAAARRRRA